jgi:hypothetical protein
MQTVPEVKSVKNGTIAKIKRMRRIEGLELESGYVVVKSEKKPLGEVGGKESRESLEKEEGKGSSWSSLGPRSSVGSTRVRSQEIVSLQEQVRQLS